MKGSKLLNGILAIGITGSILLFSDLGNRIDRQEKRATDPSKSGLRAAEGRMYKIGLTYFGPDASFDDLQNGLWAGLQELGYVKDSNLTVLSQHASGEITNLQPILLNMDNRDVDLIVVTTSPAIAAAVATVRKHPVVFTFSYAPFEAGVGKNHTDHLPNFTGVRSFPPVEKTFEFILKVLPGAKRIGTIHNSSEINSEKVTEYARVYCQRIGIKLVETTVTNTSEVFQAVSALSMRNIDAIWITGDNTVRQAFSAVVRVCHQNRIPLFINDNSFVHEGALAAIGISWFATGKHTASFVARVLKGENPANIPIVDYVEEIVTINQEVAGYLGIKIPPEIH